MILQPMVSKQCAPKLCCTNVNGQSATVLSTLPTVFGLPDSCVIAMPWHPEVERIIAETSTSERAWHGEPRRSDGFLPCIGSASRVLRDVFCTTEAPRTQALTTQTLP
ncbi:MAG: hypothetical protein NVV67_06850 [Pseudoxanthomonas sp.]|nr:hypothetical protein [Pseudoxanthomonas sp.]